MTKDLEKKYQNFNKERRYELLNYNKKRHIELLRKQSDEFNLKLLTYSAILIDHLNWEIRDQYLELLQNYREDKIDSFNFRIGFDEQYKAIEKVADLLKSNQVLLSPDKNSLNFGDLLTKIDNCCKAYSDDPEPFRNKFEIGDVEFRISIEKIYLKIQEILKEDRTTFKDSTDFSELVDQLSWETKDQYFELINEFLDESSNFLNFKERYQSIVKVGKELESNSISLKINYQALGFSNYILILIKLFDSYQIDSRISPKVFKSWVRTLFFEMKNHYS